MNPLDMMGPEFLAFYIPYSAAAFAVALAARWLWKNAVGMAPTLPTLPRWSPGVYPREGDAYAIALMRGGPREVAHTVLGRLFSTGFIQVEGQILRHSMPSGARPSLEPIEIEALAAISNGMTASQAETKIRKFVEPHLRQMAEDLERQGLIPVPAQRQGYWNICGFALLAVSGLGLAKLLVALGRGKTNVQILIILLIVFTGLGVYYLRPPLRTCSGDKYLAWLKESHRGLVNLVTSGRREDLREMVLIAGIYGLNTLPVFRPLHTALNSPSNRGDSGGGCGGGGCGGGGCGGGCGGCGG